MKVKGSATTVFVNSGYAAYTSLTLLYVQNEGVWLDSH